jgi:hypothetical protein
MKKQLINEVKQLQKIAGILKETWHPDDPASTEIDDTEEDPEDFDDISEEAAEKPYTVVEVDTYLNDYEGYTHVRAADPGNALVTYFVTKREDSPKEAAKRVRSMRSHVIKIGNVVGKEVVVNTWKYKGFLWIVTSGELNDDQVSSLVDDIVYNS